MLENVRKIEFFGFHAHFVTSVIFLVLKLAIDGNFPGHSFSSFISFSVLPRPTTLSVITEVSLLPCWQMFLIIWGIMLSACLYTRGGVHLQSGKYIPAESFTTFHLFTSKTRKETYLEMLTGKWYALPYRPATLHLPFQKGEIPFKSECTDSEWADFLHS